MSRPKTIGVKDAPPNKVLKFDARKKEEYLELLRAGGRRHASARAIRIDPGTVVNHRREDPDFDAACELAEMEADDEVEDALRMAAISGNVTAALAWLYSRRPERWKDERRHEVSGVNGKPIEMNVSHEDIDAAIDQRLEELAAREKAGHAQESRRSSRSGH